MADGTWKQFDMVPGEYETREGQADYTGRLCVIGTNLNEEELKKFTPSLDVDEAEGAIYSRDLTDVIDILQEMLRETSGGRKD